MKLKRYRVRFNKAFLGFIKQRGKYISDRNFLLIASGITGVIAGLAAVILKTFVHLIQHLCESDFDVKYENYLYLLYPTVGIMLCVLYVWLFHRRTVFDKGLGSIIYAISKKSSNIERHKTWSHVLTSALTVGFGGSAGLEAPIAVTGAAIGSNTAKNLWMSRQDRTLLLAGGAAAGIAAVFNSPIAGVIFAFEVLLSELSIPAFIPLLIAAASGAVISKVFSSGHIFFLTTNDWNVQAIPYYIILGVLCGALSSYMVRMTLKVEHGFGKIKNVWVRGITGSIILGIMLFFVPPLYGEGYGLVDQLMQGNYSKLLERSLFFQYSHNQFFIFAFCIVLIFIKVIAASVTIGSGGNGGIFGPSLFTGAVLGFTLAHGINVLGIGHVNEMNFVAVAMGGLISGVLHAPLTGIFLIAEITGGYILFVPLMLVSAVAFFVARYFEPHSIYYKTLIEHGFISKDKDKDLMIGLSIASLVETDFGTVKYDGTLRSLVDAIAHSRRNIFAVVGRSGSLKGIIMLDEVREVMFQAAMYDKMQIRDLMSKPSVIVHLGDKVENVLPLFDKNHVWNIPVVDDQQKYVGFISKAGMLNKYREQLLLRNTTEI